MSIQDLPFAQYRATLVGFDEGRMPILSWTKNPSFQIPDRYRELVPDVLYARESIAHNLEETAYRSCIDLTEVAAISKYCQGLFLSGVSVNEAFRQCVLNTMWVNLLLTHVWKIEHEICYLVRGGGFGTHGVSLKPQYTHRAVGTNGIEWSFHYVIRICTAANKFFVIDPTVRCPVEYNRWHQQCFTIPPRIYMSASPNRDIGLCNPQDPNSSAVYNSLTTDFNSAPVYKRVTEAVTPDEPLL